MDRRGMLKSLFAGGGLVAALTAARANAAADASTPDAAKVVYHLNDLDKVGFVLGNIRNHYDGVGGPERVSIVLVVHGPALKAFRTNAANPDVVRRVAEFSKVGLKLGACGNTMKAQELTLPDLLPGFTKLDQGGVVRIAELQAQGYVYLRP
jgi:uncharacterized protein